MSATGGSINSGGGGSANAVPDNEYQILCDRSAAGVITRFLRRFTRDSAGVTTVTNTTLDGTTAYTPTGTVGDCDGSAQLTDECFTVVFDGAGYTTGDKILRLTAWDLTQNPPTRLRVSYHNQNTGNALAAAPPLNWLTPCDAEFVSYDTCYKALTANPPYWNIGDTLTMIRVENYTVMTASNTAGVSFYNVSRGTGFSSDQAFPLVGLDITPCTEGGSDSIQVLCDVVGNASTPFLRRYSNSGGTLTVTDTELDGVTVYTVVGLAKVCRPCNRQEILCDDNGSFIRHYGCTDDATIDTEIDGVTLYTPVGQVRVCNQNVFIESLCDDDSGQIAQFLRHYTTNEHGVVSVKDTLLDGVTAYVTLGTVGRCVDCCPTVIGSGCWDDGTNTGTYTALRNNDGTVTLIDGVTGATVDPNNVAACTSATNVTPSIQRLVGAGTITVAAGARAVTVIVNSGSPTLQIGATTTVTLIRGTLDWGTANGEKLNAAFTFTGFAGSDFIVTTVI